MNWKITCQTTTFLLTLATLAYSLPKKSMSQEGYRTPPKEVVDVIDAKPDPVVSFSPDSNWMMLIERDAMPDIADVSRRMLRLAGLRIDPAANGRFTSGYNRGLLLKSTGQPDQPGTRIPLPDDVKLSSFSWSHDSEHFALAIVTEQGQSLYRGEVSKPTELTLLTERLNTVMGGFDWMPDGVGIMARVVPANRGPEPTTSKVPKGPNIQESLGNKSPTRTYQDLLKNPADEKLFDHYATSQLTVFDAEGNTHQVSQPGVISGFQVSPSGDYVLVTTTRRPYSYLMTYRSFPRTIEVIKLNDQLDGPEAVTIADVPMDENIPIEGVRTGRRSVRFRPGKPASLIWMEALDGGDPNVDAQHRDRLMTLSAPFREPAQEVIKMEHRGFGVSFFDNPALMMTTEYDRDRRWVRALLHDTATPGATPKTMMDRSIRDRYGDPGRIMTRRDSTGYAIARQDGDWIYRSGAGATPKGNRPFLDRQNLSSLETERLWRCDEGEYESLVAISSSHVEEKPTVITMRESKTAPSNYYLQKLGQSQGQPVALTKFKDPTPQIRGIKKQLVKYERSDGVPLSATLYLPANYQEGTRLPLLVWAYPREFNDVKTAGQVSGSTDRFTRMRGITHLTLLTQGYAVMDSATMPVIGDPETMNDTFIKQIVDSAKAAIDKAVEMGVADRNRVAVGGHSYGAFMTANLLAHSDLFKAGIARSGAYNRTLTPFGFQSERRPYWEAKEIYHKISPFLHADKINEPILLVHGENDNNSGTFPIQSKRMYQAIKGNGGIVRLCMLPYESHGYRARQSVLHTQAEMIDWLNKYVKHANSDSAHDEASNSSE